MDRTPASILITYDFNLQMYHTQVSNIDGVLVDRMMGDWWTTIDYCRTMKPISDKQRECLFNQFQRDGAITIYVTPSPCANCPLYSNGNCNATYGHCAEYLEWMGVDKSPDFPTYAGMLDG